MSSSNCVQGNKPANESIGTIATNQYNLYGLPYQLAAVWIRRRNLRLQVGVAIWEMMRVLTGRKVPWFMSRKNLHTAQLVPKRNTHTSRSVSGDVIEEKGNGVLPTRSRKQCYWQVLSIISADEDTDRRLY